MGSDTILILILLQAQAYHRGSAIETIGFLLYTGTDTVARQLSCVFSGSDAARGLIDENEVGIKVLLDHMTTMFKCDQFFFCGILANVPLRSKKLMKLDIHRIAESFIKPDIPGMGRDSDSDSGNPWIMPEGCNQRDYYRKLAAHILLDQLSEHLS
jgi:hypothetical protein